MVYFLLFRPPAEMLMDNRIKNGVVRYMRVTPPINGGEFTFVKGLIRVGKALAVKFVRINERAINVKNNQCFMHDIESVLLEG